MHCRELGKLTLLLPWRRLPWGAREQTGTGGVCSGAGLHTQEGFTLTPEVDLKHIHAGRKAAC